MANEAREPGESVTGGAVPQNKMQTSDENKGAQPITTTPEPTSPPPGPSGVSPSEDGSR